MKNGLAKVGLAIMMMVVCMNANAKEPKNYKYQFKAECNCIVSKNNPTGITKMTVYSYTNDPLIHDLAAYYGLQTKDKVDTFSFANVNPTQYICYPCLNIQPNSKYVFYLPGKDDMDEVMILLKTDDKKVVSEIK